MSRQELDIRLECATSHLQSVARTQIRRIDAGDGRTGLTAWHYSTDATAWPVMAARPGEAAAWLHIPAAAGGREEGRDPIDLARDVTTGVTDAVEMGSPCAAFYWSPSGLRIANDRLGLVRLYAFSVPGFGHVWSSRPGLAHVFSGLAPHVSQTAWSDMASLGWVAEGTAHLGNGEQMPGSTRVHAQPDGRTTTTSDRDEWIRSVMDGEVPDLAAGARGMVRSLSVASWWRGTPIADLSGGKDSRVTAAAAIRAGVVDVVRTVNTDSGEVDTARTLMDLAGHPVEHRIDPVVSPAGPKGAVLDRYLSQQRAWEGAYNARSAYRTNPFRGFRPSAVPRINGLGGEAIQGRTLLSAHWEAKLEEQGPSAGRERIHQMVRAGAVAVAPDRVADSLQSVDRVMDAGLELGMATPFMVIDHFYHFSKMPFWSLPQASPHTLLPFYSAHMMPRTMWSLSHPSVEYGRPHRELLREILPAWADVPFYKGSATTRATPWMWENEDWEELSSIVMDGVGSLNTFSPEEIEAAVQRAKDGTANVRHELALSRVMWELSFRMYADEVAREAARTQEKIQRLN